MAFLKALIGRDDFYIISRNIAEIINILNNKNIDLSYGDKCFLAGVVNAQKYLDTGKISLGEIYDLLRNNENLNNFIYSFINELTIINIGQEAWVRKMESYELRGIYKIRIQKGIDDSKKNNIKFLPLVESVLNDKSVLSFLSNQIDESAVNKNELSKEEFEIRGESEFTEDNVDNVFSDVEDSTLRKMDMYVRNGEYQEVINIDDAGYLIDSLLESNNTNKILEYSLLVGASYQELGELEIADKYYDLFLNNVSLNNKIKETFVNDGIDDNGDIKMMLLVKRLEDLGISYKLPSEEYEKLDNGVNKKKGKKK